MHLSRWKNKAEREPQRAEIAAHCATATCQLLNKTVRMGTGGPHGSTYPICTCARLGPRPKVQGPRPGPKSSVQGPRPFHPAVRCPTPLAALCSPLMPAAGHSASRSPSPFFCWPMSAGLPPLCLGQAAPGLHWA